MSAKSTGQVREAGYEALFFLGVVGGAPQVGKWRDQEDLAPWRGALRVEGEKLRRLEERGMVEGSDEEGRIPRLTGRGRAVFDGGRDVERSWGRAWDGQWRILMFDLPRQSGSSRVKFWRWLQASHLGKLQGSVWLSPDAIPDLEEGLAESGIDPSMVVMVSGDVVGAGRPLDLVATSWDFASINRSYQLYHDFAEPLVRQGERKTLSMAGLQEILREDRRLWWGAVRPDPLLPKALHPETYDGPRAWKSRRKLLKKLGKSIKDGRPD